MLVACVWELTKETIDLPLGCLQGGEFRVGEQLLISLVWHYPGGNPGEVLNL